MFRAADLCGQIASGHTGIETCGSRAPRRRGQHGKPLPPPSVCEPLYMIVAATLSHQLYCPNLDCVFLDCTNLYLPIPYALVEASGLRAILPCMPSTVSRAPRAAWTQLAAPRALVVCGPDALRGVFLLCALGRTAALAGACRQQLLESERLASQRPWPSARCALAKPRSRLSQRRRTLPLLDREIRNNYDRC